MTVIVRALEFRAAVRRDRGRKGDYYVGDTATGTQQGESRRFGEPADDRPMTFGGISIVRVECGQFAENWNNSDELSLYRQLTTEATTPAP